MSKNTHWPRAFFLIANGSSELAPGADRQTMGGKAFNLLEMARLGLPVPAALVIGTEYTFAPESCLLPLNAWGLPAMESATGLKLGDERAPLVVSVRSGAPVSMPGMLETLLNVGLCDRTVPGLLRQTGNPRFVWDAYRRLVQLFGTVVAGIPDTAFESALDEVADGRDVRSLDFSEHRTLARRNMDIYLSHTGKAFPQDPRDQLNAAVMAVFHSWDKPKARHYRELNRIKDTMGTAVTIQRMVFGNTGWHSGAGVGFTRNPTTGAPGLWMDYLINAQGEDVVGGQRNAHGHLAMHQSAPQAWAKLQEAAGRLEQHFKDMQDLEFTVQDGDLFLLQTRAGKRTTKAAMRIALDMLEEGLIDRQQAIDRTRDIREEDLVDHQLIADGAKAPILLAAADVACPGVVCGEVTLDPEMAQERARTGAPVVLVRSDARTEDIAGLHVSVGLLTQRGARTSHAAVVARQLGKPCLVACSGMRIDLAARTIRFSDVVVREGDLITLDANNGQLYLGQLSIEAIPDTALVDGLRRLRGQEQAPIPGESDVHKPGKNHGKDQAKGKGERKHQGVQP